MHQNPEETMLEYVVRKLRDPVINCAEISRRANVKRSTLSEIASGKITDPLHSTVEKIHACLREASK